MSLKARVLVWMADNERRSRIAAMINTFKEYQAIEYRSGAGNLEDIYMNRPQYVLIDIDYTISNIEEIANNLHVHLQGVQVIGMSYRWDEMRRKQLKGVLDNFLVVPCDADSVLRSLDQCQQNKAGNGCVVMAFFAPKGKSGRTTLIVNLALALARISDKRVGIIDAETNFADMETFLNLTPQSTVVEAMRDLQYLNSKSLSRYFEEVNSNVHVLCGTGAPQQNEFLDGNGVAKLINMAKANFSYLLVDLAQGFNPVSIGACEVADKVYVTVMSSGAFEMKNIEKALEIFHSLDNWQDRVSCVITRMQPDVHKRADLEDQLHCPVILLPNEYKLCSQAANNGRMAVDIGPQSALTQQIEAMAQAIIDSR